MTTNMLRCRISLVFKSKLIRLIKGQSSVRLTEGNIFCKNGIFIPKHMPLAITVSDIFLDICHRNQKRTKASLLNYPVKKTSILD